MKVSAKQAATIGERLVVARGLNGWNQTELARLARLDQGQISKWETGVEGISVGSLTALADVLGVSIDWLIRGAGAGPGRSATSPSVEELKAQQQAADAADAKEGKKPRRRRKRAGGRGE